MLNTLRWYIHKLLTLMASTPPPTHILPFETLGPQSFFNHICDTSQEIRNQYFVHSIRWYKQPSGAEHEFLIACLSDSHFILVERGKGNRQLPGSGGTISAFASSQSLPSSEACLAKDSLYAMRDTSLATLLVERKCESTGLLMEYEFRDFKLLEFARLVNIISTNRPNYQIDGSMCYWFASMVVAVAKAEFHGRLKGSKANLKLAGKNKGLPVYTANENEINKIRSIYDEARRHDPEPLGPREVSNQRNIAEIRAKAEDLRLRELQAAEDLRLRELQAAEDLRLRELQAAEDLRLRELQAAEDLRLREQQEAKAKQQELLEEIAALKRQQRN